MCCSASTTPFSAVRIAADIFEPYKPLGLDKIPSDLNLDPENRLTPIDSGYVNFNYDKAAFGDGKLPLPTTLRDLTKPEYKGKIVVTSPTTSSPGSGLHAHNDGDVWH